MAGTNQTGYYLHKREKGGGRGAIKRSHTRKLESKGTLPLPIGESTMNEMTSGYIKTFGQARLNKRSHPKKESRENPSASDWSSMNEMTIKDFQTGVIKWSHYEDSNQRRSLPLPIEGLRG